MFGFGKRARVFDGSSKNEKMLATMRDAVEQQKRAAAYEPYILTGRDLAELILDCVEEEPVHEVETALCIVGSMAGFAAASIAAQNFATKVPSALEEGAYVSVAGVDGTSLFSGGLVDAALLTGPSSFWRMVEAKGRTMVANDLPMMGEISDHVSGTLLGDAFGSPRMPDGMQCLEKPSVLVEFLWPEFLATLTARTPEMEGWCMSWGFAAQELMEAYRGQIAPLDAIKILMECAVPMARMDPNTVWRTQQAA